ncbi:Site-specific recombinase XerD [Fulvimarina manganoxydans]|uniref:Site-specific recombinase XerD n=1 Tax=Fulvimarina manganoxydans TaxID=937218 RepID=A0A1W2AQK2_9HYPH|nr:site-specific integrase [Fulvimarina manganoxydans]SMC62943.1 Site-specific recombinase XerD [Fulvimarina manganoxydans]
MKATETKAFAGMGLAQIIRANKEVGKPVITPRTVNRYLASMGAFCQWLVVNGYLDANPTADMSLPKAKNSKKAIFTTEELQQLLASPLFTGCQSDDKWRFIAKPGNVRIEDHRYWLPLVMLYSAARPAEIAQLNIADVRKLHCHWIMHIMTEGNDDKSVKTKGSMRVVPVHPELIRLGFIEYRDRMAAAGNVRLFPAATRNSRGQMVADFSREFPRYLSRLGLMNRKGLSLYSFRHGATDAFRRAGYLDENFGFILGHAKASMTGRYGHLPEGMLDQRVALIESIAYPGLDLSHLHVGKA